MTRHRYHLNSRVIPYLYFPISWVPRGTASAHDRLEAALRLTRCDVGQVAL
jgi:hypothetical protein